MLFLLEPYLAAVLLGFSPNWQAYAYQSKTEWGKQEQESTPHLSWAFRLFPYRSSKASTVWGNVLLTQHPPFPSLLQWGQASPKHVLTSCSLSNSGKWGDRGVKGHPLYNGVYLTSAIHQDHPQPPAVLYIIQIDSPLPMFLPVDGQKGACTNTYSAH